MTTNAPFKLTLYNPEDSSIEKELSRVFIPTGVFTEVVRLMKGVDLQHPETLSEDAVESIYALVCEIFGNQITIDQVKQGTDLLEVMALLTNMMARVSGVMPAGAAPANPTPPGSTRRRHK